MVGVSSVKIFLITVIHFANDFGDYTKFWLLNEYGVGSMYCEEW